MAIGRGSMTKELVGNRVSKAQVGGVPGVVTAAAAQRGGLRDATMSPPSPTISMKAGGAPRGCGCAKRGKTKGKML